MNLGNLPAFTFPVLGLQTTVPVDHMGSGEMANTVLVSLRVWASIHHGGNTENIKIQLIPGTHHHHPCYGGRSLQGQTHPYLLMRWRKLKDTVDSIWHTSPPPLLGRKEVFRDRYLPHLMVEWWVRDTWGEDHLVYWNCCVTLHTYQSSIDDKNVCSKQMCLGSWWLPEILNAINISW